MKRTAWYLFLGLCCLVGCAVLFIGGSVFFSSYELQRLIQEETAYPTPEEAFFAVHSSAHNVEIESSSASGLFGFWYVGGWEAEKDGIIAIGIALFFALGIVSSITNSDSLRGLIYSLVDVGILGFLLVLTMIIAACRDIAGLHFDRFAISLITFLGLAVGILEITGFWAIWSTGLSYNFDISLPYFSFPRMYNHLQTWTIPVLAAFPFLFPRSRLVAALCVVTLGLHWYILLVTGARGSFVSLLVGVYHC